MKNRPLRLLVSVLTLVAGCATTTTVVLDDAKRDPTARIEVFKDKSLPTQSYKVIAELTYLGPREEELKAQARFIEDAKRRGANAIIFWPEYAGVKGGGTIFQTTAWVFKAKVVVYSTPKSDDATEAASYLKQLDFEKVRLEAERGDSTAQFNVGLAYCVGYRFPLDCTEAAKWFQKSADQGSASGQNALGMLYEEGRGVSRNPQRATVLLLKAANQGHIGAQTGLALKLANGVGVPQDYVEAYKWWNLAAALGDQPSLANRDLVAKRMSPEQIAEGQRKAASFVPTKP